MRCLTLLFLFLIAISWNFGGNYHYGKWLGFLLIIDAFLACKIAEKFGWIAAITATYLLSSAIILLNYQNGRWYDLSPENYNLGIKLFSADSAFKLIMVMMFFLLIDIDRIGLRIFGRMFAVFYCLVSVGQIFWEWAWYRCGTENACGGVLGNPSLNAGMMAVVLPIVMGSLPAILAWPIVALTGIAILIGKSSVGIGIFSVFLLLHFIGSRNWKPLLLIPPAFAFGWHYWGRAELFSFGDRDVMWKFFMTVWAKNPQNWLTGTGFGTFGPFARLLQVGFGVRHNFWWPSLHNDWLEGIFTCGITGVVLMLCTFLISLNGLCRRNLWPEFKSLILFGFGMGANFPLHISLPSLYAGWLLSLGLGKENKVQF